MTKLVFIDGRAEVSKELEEAMRSEEEAFKEAKFTLTGEELLQIVGAEAARATRDTQDDEGPDDYDREMMKTCEVEVEEILRGHGATEDDIDAYRRLVEEFTESSYGSDAY